MDIFNYSRRETSEVNIGATPMGGSNPIRIQSMTNTSTQDTDACVAQAKRIVDAGGEYVRLTTQGVKEAENLMNINAALRQDGYMTPLVADVHFNPKVADVAAQYAEKVRINPGNYVDSARTFKHLEYTDEEYAQEYRCSARIGIDAACVKAGRDQRKAVLRRRTCGFYPTAACRDGRMPQKCRCDDKRGGLSSCPVKASGTDQSQICEISEGIRADGKPRSSL